MKKIVSAIAATALLMTSVSALANNVAVWNSQAAITNTNYAKAKLASLQASVKPKQQHLQTYKANIERLQQQYNSQQSNLTDAQKQDLANQIQTNMQSYDQVAEQIQTTLASSESDVLKAIGPKMQAITYSIVKAKNIDILIDSRDGNINFVKPEWDVTKDFTNKINEQVR